MAGGIYNILFIPHLYVFIFLTFGIKACITSALQYIIHVFRNHICIKIALKLDDYTGCLKAMREFVYFSFYMISGLFSYLLCSCFIKLIASVCLFS